MSEKAEERVRDRAYQYTMFEVESDDDDKHSTRQIFDAYLKGHTEAMREREEEVQALRERNLFLYDKAKEEIAELKQRLARARHAYEALENPPPGPSDGPICKECWGAFQHGRCLCKAAGEARDV